MKSREAIAPATITVVVTGISSGVTSSPAWMSCHFKVVVRVLVVVIGVLPGRGDSYCQGGPAAQRPDRDVFVLGQQEIAVHGIADVDPDPAVNLLGGGGDSCAADRLLFSGEGEV